MSIFSPPVFIRHSRFSIESSNTCCFLLCIMDSVFLHLRSLKNRPCSYFSENLVLSLSREIKIPSKSIVFKFICSLQLHQEANKTHVLQDGGKR